VAAYSLKIPIPEILNETRVSIVIRFVYLHTCIRAHVERSKIMFVEHVNLLYGGRGGVLAVCPGLDIPFQHFFGTIVVCTVIFHLRIWQGQKIILLKSFVSLRVTTSRVPDIQDDNWPFSCTDNIYCRLLLYTIFTWCLTYIY